MTFLFILTKSPAVLGVEMTCEENDMRGVAMHGDVGITCARSKSIKCVPRSTLAYSSSADDLAVDDDNSCTRLQPKEFQISNLFPTIGGKWEAFTSPELRGIAISSGETHPVAPTVAPLGIAPFPLQGAVPFVLDFFYPKNPYGLSAGVGASTAGVPYLFEGPDS